MERIQAAIQKAKEQRGEALPAGSSHAAGASAGVGGAMSRGAPARPAPVGPVWTELPAFEPDPGVLRRHHVVTVDDVDPAASHFDILRTTRAGLSNARLEAVNNKIKTTIKIGYGYRNLGNLIALIMLKCGGLNLRLPGRQ